jgi:2-methylisocitrate lyase-like PEP mutase family enzyme
MRPTVEEKRAAFRRLHEGGCFVLPNPWDAGSALHLQALGFKALASTSAGMAWSLGRLDNEVARDDVLAHLRALVAAVDLPVNADYEDAFAADPEGVAENVRLAAETGIAGVSVEDSVRGGRGAGEPLYPLDLAVARIEAARAAIDRSGGTVVLTARTEGFIVGRPDMAETVRRLEAFAAAGADCLYAPGLREEAQIAEVVRAVAPKPVNVLTFGLPVATLAGLGVRRVSLGGALARTAWGGFLEAAKEIAERGTFGALAEAPSTAALKRALGRG